MRTLFVAALAIRLLVAVVFIGSDDVQMQDYLGARTIEGDSPWTSKLPIGYYAQPLMVEFSQRTGFPPHAAQKLPAILGDLLAAFLLLRIARRRDSPRPWLWPALYLLNPVTIMLSAYHGNIDPLMAAAMLWALDLRWRAQPIAAGVSLGLALAMKPTAILQLPALLIPLRQKGNVRLAVAALGVLAAICAPFLLHDPRFGRFLSRYGGAYGEWGISLLLRQLDQNLDWMDEPLHAANVAMEQHGRYLIVAILAAWFLYALRRWRVLDFDENARLIAVTYLLFFTVTSGFGPQYLSLVLPFLLIVSTRLSIVYSAVLTPYLLATYAFASVFDKYAFQRVFHRLWTLPPADLFLLVATRVLTVAAWLTGAWVLYRLLAEKKCGDAAGRTAPPREQVIPGPSPLDRLWRT